MNYSTISSISLICSFGVAACGGSSSTEAKLIAKSIAADSSGAYVCALLSDGTVQCWGGSPIMKDSSVPVAVSSISNASAIANGGAHTCAVLSGGMVQCWGQNIASDLGSVSSADSPVPVPVSGISNATAVSTNLSHTCARLCDGTVQCWGDNYPTDLPYSYVPLTVSGITNAVAVAAGEFSACALLSDGTVQCWGDNFNGDLGDGSTSVLGNNVPVPASGITNAIAISAGPSDTCSLLGDGTVQCWGWNTYGQLGNGTTLTNSSVPVTVSGITNAVAVSTGNTHTCAVLSSGSIQCWGNNPFGQLGNGTTTDSSVPVTVSGITNAVAVTTGEANTCALLSGGSVQCWGGGELGNGTTTNSSVPVTVSGF